MDLIIAINNIKSLDGFVTVTHDFARSNESIPLNMSTALALKKIRAHEFKYFTKYQESGLAFMLMSQLLKQPPGRSWLFVGKEVADILLYWLEGLLCYLIKNCQNWDIFLDPIVQFINELRVKHYDLNTVLVEKLAQQLCALAICDQMSVSQRLAVVRCLNHCLNACSPVTRHALSEKLSVHLTKMAHMMLRCEHMPTQLATFELMMRFLVNRNQRAAREQAASRWLDNELCSPLAKTIFLASDFRNFFKAARTFLNALNEQRDSVTSVICHHMTICHLIVVSGSELLQTWLDVNPSHKSMSMVIHPSLLRAMKVHAEGYECLTFEAENTVSVELLRDGNQYVMSVQSVSAPDALHAATADALQGLCTARLLLSPDCDVLKLDKALSRAFDTKYQIHLSLELRPEVESSEGISAHLPQKLSALPRLEYDKEPRSVCRRPNISPVAELSEPDEILSSLQRYRASGVVRCPAKSKTSLSDTEEVKRASGVVRWPAKSKTSLSETEKVNRYSYARPADSDPDVSLVIATLPRNKASVPEDFVDLLAQEALANEKDRDRDKKYKSNEEGVPGDDSEIENTPMVSVHSMKAAASSRNLVNKSQPASDKKLVNKSTSKESNTEAIVIERQKKQPAWNQKPVNKSTSDESNTEAIEATQYKPYTPADTVQKRVETSDDSTTDAISQTPFCRSHVTVRRKHLKSKKSNGDEQLNDIDSNDIEMFHASNRRVSSEGKLRTKQTLRRTEYSSKTSESFEPTGHTFEVNPTDIANCINFIIDKVCENIEKCNEIPQKQDATLQGAKKYINRKKTAKAPKRAPKSNMAAKKKVPKQGPKKTATKKGNPLIENDAGNEIKKVEGKTFDTPTPQRKKRKLYSPKDVEKETHDEPNAFSDDDLVPLMHLSNTPKRKTTPKTTPTSAAISYKDLEKERQNNTKTKRKRKSKTTTPVLSPKTLKSNSIFDQLKENIENKDVRIVDKKSSGLDTAVYNFTSGSEDDVFQNKIVDMRKSATTLCSNDSMSSRGRVLRKVKHTEGSADEDCAGKRAKKGQPKRRPAKRRGKKAVVETKKQMVDERMRDAKQKELDTSLVVERTRNEKHVHNDIANEEEPAKSCAKDMELMDEVDFEEISNPVESELTKTVTQIQKTDYVKEIPTKKINKKKSELSLKKNRKDAKRNYTKLTEESTRESPLPALTIETTAPRPDDELESTTSSNLIKKCNRMFVDGYESFDDTVAARLDTDNINYSPVTQDSFVDINLCETVNVSKQKDTKKPKARSVETGSLINTKKFKPCFVKLTPVTRVDINHKQNSEEPPKETCNVPALEIIDLSNDDDDDEEILGTRDSDQMAPSPLQLQKQFEPTTEPLTPKEPQKETYDISPEITNPSNDEGTSIDTNSIRCDSDKVAPSLPQLEEQFEPRNIELEQLSPSMQDASMHLQPMDLISEPEHSRKKEKKEQVKKTNSSITSSSPVVSLKRMSYEEFKKWLPSPKSTFTEDSQEDIRQRTKKIRIVKSSAIVTGDANKELPKTRAPTKARGKGGRKTKKVIDVEVGNSVTKEMSTVQEIVKTKLGFQNKTASKVTKKNGEKLRSAPERAVISSISPVNLDDEIEELLNTASEVKTDCVRIISEIFHQTPKKTKTNISSDHESSDDVHGTPKALSTNPEGRKRSLLQKNSPSKWRKVSGASPGCVSKVSDWLTMNPPGTSTADDSHSACDKQEALQTLELLREKLLNTHTKLVHMEKLQQQRKAACQEQIRRFSRACLEHSRACLQQIEEQDQKHMQEISCLKKLLQEQLALCINI